MATYKITVEIEEVVTRIAGKEWRPVSESKEGGTKYDYTPEIEKRVVEGKRIYEQTVENLDLVAVISAVNRMNVVTKET